MESALDERVRLDIYRFFVEHARPPVAAELAPALGASVADIEDSYRRLADAHVIVLLPGSTYIWMANPLSAIPTAFRVTTVDGAEYFGNCIWDGLGVLAMLHTDGIVATSCPDCAEPLRVRIRSGEVAEPDGVVHFLVPATDWWDDIGHT